MDRGLLFGCGLLLAAVVACDDSSQSSAGALSVSGPESPGETFADGAAPGRDAGPTGPAPSPIEDGSVGTAPSEDAGPDQDASVVDQDASLADADASSSDPDASVSDAGVDAAPPTPPPDIDITALEPTPLGIHAFSANARIQPHAQAMTYHFEYGETASYGSQTPEQPAPPTLAAHYRESWDTAGGDDAMNGWLGGWTRAELAPVASGGDQGTSFVRYTDIQSAGDDPGHLDGIGLLHLTQFFYPGCYDPGDVPAAFLGGGHPDLRDAEVTVNVRGVNWLARQEELTTWLQVDLDPAKQYTSDFRKSNWAHTGQTLTSHLLSGSWETATYTLANNTNDWSYAGTNESRPNYTYAPLDTILRDVNTDFFHNLIFVDVDREPSGSIDFDSFELTYRNHSLLLPSNGGTLVAAPLDGDPSHLTDGWRSGVNRTWRTAESPSGPYEFEYAFAAPVTLTAVQIHNDPEFPSRDVEVLVSEDGADYTRLGLWELPASASGGKNFLFHIERKISAQYATLPIHDAPIRRLKLRVLSGWQTSRWGIGELEAFGTGATMVPDDAWFNVTQDVPNLKPSTKYHYRLVTKAGDRTFFGPDQTFTTPSGDKPLVTTGPISRLGPGTAVVTGRVTPLGHWTVFHIDYGETTDYGQQLRPGGDFAWLRAAGKEMTPRTVSVQLENLVPGKTYHYRIVLEWFSDDFVYVLHDEGQDMQFVAQ